MHPAFTIVKPTEGGVLHLVVSPPGSVSFTPSPVAMITDVSDGYPMAEAVDEATFIVRQFLEDPDNDCVRPPITLGSTDDAR
jgi:hypothetical protein